MNMGQIQKRRRLHKSGGPFFQIKSLFFIQRKTFTSGANRVILRYANIRDFVWLDLSFFAYGY